MDKNAKILFAVLGASVTGFFLKSVLEDIEEGDEKNEAQKLLQAARISELKEGINRAHKIQQVFRKDIQDIDFEDII